VGCDEVGWYQAGSDGDIMNVVVGASGKQGFLISGGNNYFTNCKAYGCGNLDTANGQGFYVVGSRNGFVNCIAQDNYKHGFSTGTVSDISFAGCQADNNGWGATNTYHGFYIYGSTNVTLSGCATYNWRDDPDRKQANGIHIDGTSSYIKIVGHSAGDNLGVPIYIGDSCKNIVIDELPQEDNAVFTLNGRYYAKDRNGIQYAGTNATTVINNAFNLLTNGRTSKEKLVIIGEYSGLGRITIPSYTILEVRGRLTAMANLNQHFIYSANTTNIEISGGTIDANSAQQSYPMDTVYLLGVSFSQIHDCYIYGGFRNYTQYTFDGEALELEGCNRIDVYDNIFENTQYCYDMIKLTTGTVYCTIRGNILRSDVTGYGDSLAIQLADSTTQFNVVSGNVIKSRSSGIKMHHASDNLIIGNIVSAIVEGIACIDDASRNSIVNNYITSYSTQTPMVGLQIRIASTGITSADNIFKDNTIKLNNITGAVGIQLRMDTTATSGTITRTRIIGNVIFGGTASDTGILLSVTTGLTISNTNIAENDLSDANLDTKVSDTGSTGTIFKRNRGYVTENSGTVYPANNGTVITHGLAGTPNLITLTLSGSRNFATGCYLLDPTVIATSSTTFTIELLYYNVTANAYYAVTPSVYNATIYWNAQI
jgi:hypothetical protein